ncbi:hypothetical protein CVT24_006262 [Panaeolus cyanescens]|uniref:Protein kinase regulator n=1 Tax=Panaeolus cyanescens TaxID=181874 RepID=A0A409V8H9_9AGAR|nr:hypothetical protein CVT24_006262 [Panaeolus cyanescens]
MEISTLDKPLMDWDESDVHQWLTSLGASQYEHQLREQSIRGDVVCMLDSDGLKSLGINTIGQRLAVLRGIYQLKLAHGIPIAPGDYVPPSAETTEVGELPSVHELYTTVQDQSQRLRALEAGNRKLVEMMHHFIEDISKCRSSETANEDDSSSKLRKQINLLRGETSTVVARSPSPVAATQEVSEREPITSIPDSSISAYLTPQSTTHDSTEHNSKVSLEDPTSKVLPAALRKHRIKPQDWPNYAMLITYGPPSNRIKRRLEPDEKPLYLFKKLKDAKKNPAFVLKNMKELRTPALDERQDFGSSSDTSWLSMSRNAGYETQIRENNIRGDSLCSIDPDGLKALGISTIGQRLAILKAIYQIKVAHNVPITEDQYIPPSEALDRNENLSLERLHSVVKDQAQRLRSLEEDNRTLTSTLQSFLDEFSSSRNPQWKSDEAGPSLHRQPSFKWAQFVKPQKSPTKPDTIESPHPSPQRAEHDTSTYSRLTNMPSIAHLPEKSRTPPPAAEPSTSGLSIPKPGRQESSDNLKSFKVSLEDPTWKVLPAALKKYRIHNDSWQNYAMFICYGPSGNRIERCLSYDEKPLLLFQRLKDTKKNPVFMLKHIKDIRSPIAVAQQKHAARKASSVISQETTITSATHGHQKAQSVSRSGHRPPKLEVQELSGTPTMAAALSPQPGWPEGSMASPAVEPSRPDEMSMPPISATSHNSVSSTLTSSTSTLVNSSITGKGSVSESSSHSAPTREMPSSSSGVSYAVAIYPYMAEQEDEFDVVVGDTFVIVSRSRGWWVVQRDPTGSGVVDPDLAKQGWVPAGCLLETNVPVASAIAEATAKNSSSTAENVSKTPILPLSIISTSFPGIALMDYKKKGEEELDLVKDDALRVFKRYNHWSYAVKEVGGDRGWVPSWFIGKVTASGAQPSTPNSSIPPVPAFSNNPALETEGQTQVSPMSSAFPPV